MSRHILELRNVYRADGTTERCYRIGTGEWVTIRHFSQSVEIERQDGTYDRRDA